MKTERPGPSRADATLLRKTVWQLTAANRVLTVALIAIVAWVWWILLQKVVRFGKGIDYSGLEAFGARIATFIKQYNPFFWWAIVALCTLIIAYFLFGFVQAMNRRAAGRYVAADIVALLASRLSPPAVEVLQWSWVNRRDPITVGVLQRALHELKAGRAAKIALASSHAALLHNVSAEEEDEKALSTD